MSGYRYDLPERLIAQQPTDRRGDSRLLVVHREGGAPESRSFRDFPDFVRPGDLLVVNDTRVLPARLWARKEATGGRVELLAVRPLADGAWAAMVRPSARVAAGTRVCVVRRGPLAESSSEDTGAADPILVVGDDVGSGLRQLAIATGAQGDTPRDLSQVLERWGEMPLPPYIRREDGPRSEDRHRYQCVYAAHEGAVAAPTAGLHFTNDMLDHLRAMGVAVAPVTLHVGPGTFQPIRTENLADHSMHTETFCVPPETARQVERCIDAGGRVVAVGTTVCRSLESWHRMGRPADGAFRETSLFLRPGDGPRLKTALLTNFHLPESSLLVLVASLLGRERALDIYAHAVQKDYRFYSYGDAMLIL
ncbi:MAG: tRNA preQ1(34) S-adenosylmethionine ribosyltransferase-isomerase QueA [Deltaproteobacteria bacterium]|nr:tRNA preQ1(34) S-adenosylmethionine ribosyltransferase-isomerase QueA [Deltaproteobacteria bacterium]